MGKIVIYGHTHCPNCATTKEFLMKKNVQFDYQNTSESLAAFKAFVNLRESRPEFSQAKEQGSIGFPCIVVNDGEKIIVGHNEEALAQLS